jgi:hypothetical protein
MRRWWWIPAGILGAAVILLLSFRQNQDVPPPAEVPRETGGAVTGSPAGRPADPTKAILGRWLRPDGGYVLELRQVRPDGRAEAAYFNPNPIHVARAEVKPDGAKAVVLVELRDINYPGCIYRLTYDPAADQLRGDYFQAALEQTFEVIFVRAPGG